MNIIQENKLDGIKIPNSHQAHSIKISENYQNNNLEDDKIFSRSNSDELSNKMKRKKKSKYNFSLKYTIFLIILWLIFVASFIIGFIVHFDFKSSVTASSILWTFSSLMFCINVVYSIIYYKAKNSKTQEELGKYLKFVPV